MRVRTFARLLIDNRFRVHPSRWGLVATVSLASLVNSCLYRWQRLSHGRRLDATQLEYPPVFIIGHWRSGTTFLHELLTCDDQFGYPTTYECFAPHHFLITESVLPGLLGFLIPKQRPMDHMAAGFERPQEDEFALCGMGAPTPYLRMAFPNHPPVHMETLDLEDVAEDDLQTFKRSLESFVTALTYRHRKRLVLKSPPHTGRIALLAEMFPARSSFTLSAIHTSCMPRRCDCGRRSTPRRASRSRTIATWMRSSSSRFSECTGDSKRNANSSMPTRFVT